MIEVSTETQEAYLSDSCLKNVQVFFPDINLTLSNNDIVTESLQIKESILDKSSLEFVGCISSFASIQVYGRSENFKGQHIEISVRDENTNTKINLFHGIVDSDKGTASRGIKTLEAYDRLYDLSNVDMTDWWNSHAETTQYKLLEELLKKVGLNSRYSFLANGNLPAFCGSKRKVSQLSALDVLKQLCQASGGFGKINRDGAFQVLYIGEKTIPAWYPSKELFPSKDIFPSKFAQSKKVDIDPTKFDAYREVKYEDFVVVPIQKVVIRDSEDSIETSYGEGENKYIVQGNLFIFDQTEQDRNTMARNIYLKTKGITFTPFNSYNNGLPFIECGDSVIYDDLNTITKEVVERQFIIFNRVLKGIQAMKDKYGADGEEYQRVFITDLQAQLDQLKSKNNSNYNKTNDELEALKQKVSRLEALVKSNMYQIDNPKVQGVVKQTVFNKDANFVIDDFVVGVENE